MKEKFNSQWNYNGNQGVYNKHGLISEGFICFGHEKSILLEYRRDKKSHITYKSKRIVANIKSSIFNDWQIKGHSFNNKIYINKIRRVQ